MSRKPANHTCSGILTAVFAVGSLFAGVAHAQESGATAQARSTVLEEVIVTARKRAESLQNVPVSIIALDDEKLDDFGLQTLESISAYVPGVTIGEAVVSTNLFVRGIGSGVNQGFEQSVGVYVDGVYMGRGFQARAPFLDLERIEILKGPQGTLFGKNTIAGALNIVTARPTDEFEGEVTALYEPDHGEGALTAVVSGPLSDTLSARLAARVSTFDGYMRNTFSGEKDPREDDRVIRASLRWTPTDRLEINTKFETGSFDVDGRVSQALSLDATTLALFQGFDPEADGTFNERRSLGGEHPLFAAEFNHADVDNFVATIDYSLGDHTLTSVTGYSAYDYHEVAEGDFTPLDTANQDTVQDFKQWSQEVRLASSDDRPFRYIVGLYYHKAELDSVIRVDIDLRDLLGAPIIGSRHNTFLHDAETFAAFFEASLDFGARWTLNAGLRYSDEKKSVWKRQVSAELGTDIPDPGSLLFVLGWVNHTLEDKRSESQAAPSVSLQFDAAENVMTYVSASKGFKGGGYDEARADGNPDLFEYEEETVVSVEAGVKMTLLDGAATLNAAAFHSNFEDLQVSTFEGINFIVGNAAEATTQGLEIDGSWRVSDALTLAGAMTVLDAEYDSFPGGACYANQTEADGCVGGRQDLAGGKLQFAPDLSANLNAEYATVLGNSMQFSARVDLNYSDDILLANDNDPDPAQSQSSYVTVDARVALAGADDRWEIAVIGRNLTDKLIRSWANDLPVVTNNNYFAHLDRPRNIAVQFRYSF